MNPNKVSRDRLGRLEDLPNIGPAGAPGRLELGVLYTHMTHPASKKG